MIKTIFTHAVALAALSLLSISSVSAQLLKTGPSVFNYNYVDLAYIDDDAADGIGLRFSADIRENYALQVEYSRVSAGRFDADRVSGGLAYHIAGNNRGQMDWVFDFGFEIIDAGGDSETGLYTGAGIRFALTDALEVNSSLDLSTAIDTDLTLSLRALYEVATGFSAMVETEIGDGSSLGLGLRFYWR